jgi:hypothetical protein
MNVVVLMGSKVRRSKPVVSHISRKTSEMPRISCTQPSDTTVCAPFFKKRRIQCAEPTNLDRKSGMWGTRRFVVEPAF